MNIVSRAKELLNQVLSAYSEEKNVYNSLTSFVIGNIEAESFTINIPLLMVFFDDCFSSNLKVNELILKKATEKKLLRLNAVKQIML